MLFLSYNRADSEAVRQVRVHLQALGVRTFLDSEQLTAGLSWPEALERVLKEAKAVAVFLGGSGLGLWQKREMFFALDLQVERLRNAQALPVIPVLLHGAEITPGFLFLNTWVDLRSSLRDAEGLAALAKAVDTGEADTWREPRPAVCPYQALSAFEEVHAAFYFGREQFAQDLFEKVRQRRLVALVGPSGSGKSSVAFAGLLPLLRRERPPRPTWDAVSFTPGNSPWRHLADALVPLLPNEPGLNKDAGKVAQDIAAGAGGLQSTVRTILKRRDAANRLLVIVDQFEELATLVKAADEARRFIDTLLEASRAEEMYILVTLRADFYGRAIELSRDFSDQLAAGLVNLGPLREAELRAIIEKPAERIGVPFDPGLADRIVNDVKAEPGNLPLLEYALTELWKANPSRLTHEAYTRLGGFSRALANIADAVLKELSAAEKQAARRLFTRLVRLSAAGEEGADTRYRARRSEVGEDAWKVADRFAVRDVRLVILSRDSSSGEELVEVAHEALIRNWNTLHDWIAEDRRFLEWRQRLQFLMAEWERTGRSEAAALRGVVLEEALDWLNRRGEDLNPRERTFIEWTTNDAYQVEKVIVKGAGLLPFARDQVAGEWRAVVFLNDPAAVPADEDALSKLVKVMAAIGRLDKAVSFAKAIVDPEKLADALAIVISPMAAAGRLQEALDLAKELREVAGGIEEWRRLHPIKTAVEALAIAGQLDEAFELVENLGRYQRNDPIRSACRALVRSGKAAEAFNVAGRVSDLDERAETFAEIARTLADAGAPTDAARAAYEALATGANSKGYWRLNQSGWAVMTFAAASGLQAAIAAVLELAGPVERVDILTAAAHAFAQSARAEEASACAKATLEFMRAIEEAYQRQSAGARLVEKLVDAEMLELALETARALERRADALVGASEALLKQDRAAEAASVSEEALGSLGPDYVSEWVTLRCARLLVYAGRRQRALEVLRTLPDPPRVLLELCRACSDAGRSEDVAALAGELLPELSETSPIRELCQCLLAVGLPFAMETIHAHTTPGVKRAEVLLALGTLLARAGLEFEETLQASGAGLSDTQMLTRITLTLLELMRGEVTVPMLLTVNLAVVEKLIAIGRYDIARSASHDIASKEERAASFIKLARAFRDRGQMDDAVSLARDAIPEAYPDALHILASASEPLPDLDDTELIGEAARALIAAGRGPEAGLFARKLLERGELEQGMSVLAQIGEVQEALNYTRKYDGRKHDTGLWSGMFKRWLTAPTSAARGAVTPAEAVEIVNSIADADEQAVLMSALIPVLTAAQEIDRALEFAARISVPSWQARRLIEAAGLSATPGALLEAALRACKDISENYERTELAFSMVPFLAKIGEKAGTLEAGITMILKTHWDPARALSEFAAGLAKAGRHESARSVAAKVLDGVAGLSEYARSFPTAGLLQGLVVNGMAEDALKLARSRPTPRECCWALIAIIPSLAASGHPAEARAAGAAAYETGAALDNPYDRSDAVRQLMEAFVSAGMTEDALLIARREGTEALLDATATMARAGQAEAAWQAAGEVRAEARKFNDSAAARKLVIAVSRAIVAGGLEHKLDAESVTERVYGMIGVVLGLLDRSRGREAIEATRTVILLADDIKDAHERTGTLRHLASELLECGITTYIPNVPGTFPEVFSEALIDRGKVAAALAVAERAVEGARLELFLRAIPLLTATGQAGQARALTRQVLAANGPDLVSAHVKRMLHLKLEIDHPAWCTALIEAGRTAEALAIAREPATLQAIADALIHAGKSSEALAAARRLAATDRSRLADIVGAFLVAETFSAALEFARLVEDPDTRAQLIAATARAMARKADPEAVSVAREIETPGERVTALALASRMLHKQELLDEAFPLVDKIGVYDERGKACARIAVAWAAFGAFEKSRETAELCHLAQEKLWAYTAIVKNYVTRQKPELTAPLAETISAEL
jgi:hypothetical protein